MENGIIYGIISFIYGIIYGLSMDCRKEWICFKENMFSDSVNFSAWFFFNT